MSRTDFMVNFSDTHTLFERLIQLLLTSSVSTLLWFTKSTAVLRLSFMIFNEKEVKYLFKPAVCLKAGCQMNNTVALLKSSLKSSRTIKTRILTALKLT